MDVEDESPLELLEIYFKNNTNDDNKGEFQFIENILKDEVFDKTSFTLDDIVNAVHSDVNIRFSVRGYKVRPKPPELNADPTVVLSKKMAAILRHGLFKSGLEISNGCYVQLNELLKLPEFQGFTREDIVRIVNCTEKRRYEILNNGSVELIGALQGHSLNVENCRLIPVDISYPFKKVYHGTFFSNWESIKKEGLKLMGRTHIHLYTSESPEFVRDLSEIIIEVDLESAIKDGLKFFLSRNNVLLCEGENGILKTCYFIKAWDVKSNEIIYSNTEAQSNSETPAPSSNLTCNIG